jgi:hypothetical protein
MMNTRHFGWFLWAFGLLMLVLALASFFGDLMPIDYGVLALVTAAATAVIAFVRRRIDELLNLSRPKQRQKRQPTRRPGRTSVEQLSNGS